MILFYTNSTKHLVKDIKTRKGKFIIKKFSDGEYYVKIKENVKNKPVWIVASTNPPMDNLMELILLLDALKREQAKINLLITYFGYARQDRIQKGEAFSSKLICDWFKKFKLNRIVVIHMHGERLKRFLNYENIIPIEIFSHIINKTEVIVAPDKGAIPLAKKLSEKYKLNLAIVEKSRLEKEHVKVLKIKGKVKNKKVIVTDDIISTGSTILEVSKKLKYLGASEILVISTHGIFSGNVLKRIEKSPIKKVYVTNSIFQKQRSKKVKVLSLSKLIESMIKT